MKTKTIICFALASLFGFPELAHPPATRNWRTCHSRKTGPRRRPRRHSAMNCSSSGRRRLTLWALPLINTLGMKVGSEKVFGAGYNVLPVC